MLQLPASLLEHLQSGGRLLVPSRQRAAAVRLAYAWQQQKKGVEVWRTPAVESLGGWAARRLGSAALSGKMPAPRQLDRLEEWLLWRRAAQRLLAALDEQVRFGLSADSLADRLQQAAAVVGEYDIDREALAKDASQEARWLTEALLEVEKAASQRNAIARHQRFAMLARVAPAQEPERTLQVGVAAEARGMQAMLQRAGIVAWEASSTDPDGIGDGNGAGAGVRAACCADPQAEIAAAAAWCANHLRANPEARLLVIVTDLAPRRALVERIFAEQLAPRFFLGISSSSLPYGLEGGRPLADYFEPREALRALLALANPSSDQDLAEVLELEFWGRKSRAARSRAATLLRQRQERRTAPDKLAARLSSLLPKLRESDRAPLEECALRIARAVAALDLGGDIGGALSELGWASGTQVDSQRQQIRDRWHELLESFARFTDRARSVDLWAAMVRRDVFAPAAEDVAVTLTASLDHPVVGYDGIWVTSLQADRWPRPRQFDPLIPWYLQRAAATPGSDSVLRLREATRAMAAWRSCTADLVLSYAAGEADEKWLPSPLLANLPHYVPPSVTSFAQWQRTAASVTLEHYHDDTGPRFDVCEAVPGGVSALVDQHECAFKAFARRRLCGREADEAEPGITASDRGTLLHLVLRKFWTETTSRAALCALDRNARERALARAVEAAIADPEAARLLAGKSKRILEREYLRAQRVLLQVLEIEEQRSDFEVLANEHEIIASLGGARLRARIDRIDRVQVSGAADGAYTVIAVIDYKSGRYATKKFSGPDLSAIQLWAYALLLEANDIERGRLSLGGSVGALANLHLLDRGRRYAATACAESLLPGVKAEPAWAHAREEGERRVGGLIQAFLDGDARVMPGKKACEHCELSMLCRRWDLGLLADADDSDEVEIEA